MWSRSPVGITTASARSHARLRKWQYNDCSICGSLNHVTDATNMIGRRSLVDDHMHTPKVRVPTKQPLDTDKKWGLTIPQHQEQCPQSPREVASTLTFAMGLRRHGIPMWRCANVLPHCQLPCHLQKRRNESK
jgi:hypothetical protein